jgi:septum formation protein
MAPEFWRMSQPLILASASQGRRMLLENVGIPLAIRPHTVDERAEEKKLPTSCGAEIALALAEKKADSVHKSGAFSESYILGADQTLSCEGRLFAKSATYNDAKETLRFLSGKTHKLHTAIALMRGQTLRRSFVCESALTMRTLTDSFIESYLQSIGDRAYHCLGVYPLESFGPHLFSSIKGDYFTILGLPLLDLLQIFREEGALMA